MIGSMFNAIDYNWLKSLNFYFKIESFMIKPRSWNEKFKETINLLHQL